VKLIFLQDDAGIKEVSFTKRQLFLAVLTFLLVGGGLVYFSLNTITNTMYSVKLNNVKQNNERLVSLLGNLQTRLDSLDQYVGTLQTQDDAIRTYANLPEIDQDVKNLGIGGTRYDKTSELDYLLPEEENTVSDLLFDVDQVARKIKLQRLSTENLYNAIRTNAEEIQSTPSIIPVEGGYFTDGFGWRYDPFNQERRFHYGQDISARRGTPIHAAADGVVQYAKRRSSFGLVVAIDHGFGYKTLYAHMDKMDVAAGDRVTRGQKIGEVGNTGRSTGPHLHFEVHLDDIPMQPRDYFFTSYLD